MTDNGTCVRRGLIDLRPNLGSSANDLLKLVRGRDDKLQITSHAYVGRHEEIDWHRCYVVTACSGARRIRAMNGRRMTKYAS